MDRDRGRCMGEVGLKVLGMEWLIHLYLQLTGLRCLGKTKGKKQNCTNKEQNLFIIGHTHLKMKSHMYILSNLKLP